MDKHWYKIELQLEFAGQSSMLSAAQVLRFSVLPTPAVLRLVVHLRIPL